MPPWPVPSLAENCARSGRSTLTKIKLLRGGPLRHRRPNRARISPPGRGPGRQQPDEDRRRATQTRFLLRPERPMIGEVFGWGSMRFLLGVLVGIVLTIVAVFFLDQGTGGEEQKSMVNWDVVGEKLGTLTSEARQVWADFTREMTGPP